MRKTILGVAGLALAIAGSLTATMSAAQAAPAKPALPATQCVVNIETGRTKCFGTAREAIAEATGGSVTSAAGLAAQRTVAGSKLTAQLNAPSAAANVLIAAFSYWADFAGPTYYYSAPAGCSGQLTDVDHAFSGFPEIDGVNMNNNVRSFQSFNNCWVKLYDTPLWDSPSYGFSGTTANLGDFNDRNESVLIS